VFLWLGKMDQEVSQGILEQEHCNLYALCSFIWVWRFWLNN